jgi:hypothetical protein
MVGRVLTARCRVSHLNIIIMVVRRIYLWLDGGVGRLCISHLDVVLENSSGARVIYEDGWSFVDLTLPFVFVVVLHIAGIDGQNDMETAAKV